MPRLNVSSKKEPQNPPTDRQSSTKSNQDSKRPSTSQPADIFEDEGIQGQKEHVRTSLDQLDTYIEYLYETMDKKMQGTAAIRELISHYPEALVLIASKDSVLAALSRVLVEDGRRSMDLTTGINEMRQKIMQNRVGDSTMKTLQREIGRFALWKAEIDGSKGSSTKSKQMADKIKLLIKRQDTLFYVAISLLMKLGDDVAVEIKMVKRDIVGYIAAVLDIQTMKAEMFKEIPVNHSLISVTFRMLLRLTQFRENHMRILALDSQFIQQLVNFTRNADKLVQTLGLQILCNLCQTPSLRAKILENKEFLTLCSSLLSDPNIKVASLAVRLCYFSSMSILGKQRIVDTSIIPNAMRKLLEFPGNVIPSELGALICNLAQDDQCLSMICGQDDQSDQPGIGFKLLMKRALKTSDPYLWKILRTIASSDEESVKAMFLSFLDDILKYLAKVDSKAPFKLGQEAQAVIFVSIIGILGSLKIPDFDFVKLNERYDILAIVSSQILTNLNVTRNTIRNPPEDDPANAISQAIHAADDTLLECLSLLDTMLMDTNIVDTIMKYKVANPDSNVTVPGRPTAASGRKSSILPNEYTIAQLIMSTIQMKQDDVEILLCTLKTLYSFLCNDEPCALLIGDEHSLEKLHALTWDQNDQIRVYAELCLTLLEDYEREVGNLMNVSRITKEKRFQFHNAEWVMSVQDSILDLLAEYSKSNNYNLDSIHRISEGQGIMLAPDEQLFSDDIPDLENDQILTVQGQQIQFVH